MSMTCPHHDVQHRRLRHLPVFVLVHLQDLLRRISDGDEHPSGARELLDERGGQRRRGRADVNRVVRPVLGHACNAALVFSLTNAHRPA